MSQAQFNIEQLGDELFDALNHARMVAPLTERFPQLAIEDAYAIPAGASGCR